MCDYEEAYEEWYGRGTQAETKVRWLIRALKDIERAAAASPERLREIARNAVTRERQEREADTKVKP